MRARSILLPRVNDGGGVRAGSGQVREALAHIALTWRSNVITEMGRDAVASLHLNETPASQLSIHPIAAIPDSSGSAMTRDKTPCPHQTRDLVSAFCIVLCNGHVIGKQLQPLRNTRWDSSSFLFHVLTQK